MESLELSKIIYLQESNRINIVKLSYSRTLAYFILLVLVSIIGYLVSSRDLLIGTDALTYRSYYLNLEYYNYGDRTFEIGYHFFNYIIFLLGFEYSIFLFVYFVVYNFVLIKAFDIFSKNLEYNYIFKFILFYSILLFSSWYISATLNGLRQGFSLALLYLSFSYLLNKNNKLFLFFLCLSCLFHDSTILIVPFLFLFFLSFNKIFLLFIIFSIFYPLGFNEYIINIVSNFVDLPLHDAISSYSEKNEVWKGFQLDFFIYTFFWCILFSFIKFKFLRGDGTADFLNKVILVLSIFYFVFGFGSFSNRFGFVAWSFFPIIQSYYFLKLFNTFILHKKIFIIICFSLINIGFLNYYFVLRPLI